MKKNLAILAFIFLLGCSQSDFQTTDGNDFNFNDYHGQWLVLNYWASWCAPCKHEIPELNLIHKESNIEVVGVNFDALSHSELQQEIKRFKIQYPVLEQNPKEFLKLGEPIGLPLNYIINPQGKVVQKLYGPQTFESIKAHIESWQKKSQ